MVYQDTVAAIATSSKNGSISIIRVSGNDSCEIVSRIFYNKKYERMDLSQCGSHTIQYGLIGRDQNTVIDEVLVMIMKGPASYTAEDVVEIQCHGGHLICQIILDLLIENGARVAEPGEFTKRAFLNGRIDLSQAESVMDLIQAKSEAAIENSVRHLRGNVRDKIICLRELILQDVSFLEASLDDPEHIPMGDFSTTMREHTIQIKRELSRLLDNSQNGRIIKEGIRTTIVGKPNVGKSSFLNCILREDRAIVTNFAGTTRDTLEEEARIGSILLRLIDTAGIRKTEDEIEKIGIEKAKKALAEADFIICIIDASKQLEEEDIYILDQAKDYPGVILCNKSDLETVIHKEEIPEYENKKIMDFSAVTGEGLDLLEDYMSELFQQDQLHYNDEIYITNTRQKEALLEAAESMNRLWESIETGMPEDLYSIDLINAYESLGKIIGETIEDDIIDKIFKDFCMGK